MNPVTMITYAPVTKNLKGKAYDEPKLSITFSSDVNGSEQSIVHHVNNVYNYVDYLIALKKKWNLG